MKAGALASVLGAAVLTGGCTTISPIDRGGTDPVAGWNAETRRFAVENWLYAQLAINAYDDHEAFILPGTIHRRTAPDGENNGIGYAYALYDRVEGGATAETIIAYRGTENVQDVLHGGILGTQHNRGSVTALAVGEHLRQSGNNVVSFSLTGHSLGGGIAYEVSAHTLGEGSVGIGRIVAFNSAPRFASLGGDVERRSLVERGDWLGFLRQFGARPGENHSIDCQPGFDPARDHSMRDLAECLTWIAAYDDEGARLSLAQNPVVAAPAAQSDPLPPPRAAGLTSAGVPVNVDIADQDLAQAVQAELHGSNDLSFYELAPTGFRLDVTEASPPRTFAVQWSKNDTPVDDLSGTLDCSSLSLAECAQRIVQPAAELIMRELALVSCPDLPKAPLSQSSRERCGLAAPPDRSDGR